MDRSFDKKYIYVSSYIKLGKVLILISFVTERDIKRNFQLYLSKHC